MKKIVFLLGLFLLSFSGMAQGNRLKVFLDCSQTWICNTEYVRSEIRLVDFVRDRFDADLHILVNHQTSSSGGTQVRLTFIGMRRFANATDTLTYFIEPAQTDDISRQRMVHFLQLGLTRYLVQSGQADKVKIEFHKPGDSTASSTVAAKDPWNYWVFLIGGSMNLSGSQNTESRNFDGWINADRETEDWKINFSVNANRSDNEFVDGDRRLKFARKEYASELQIARSINDHWSYGGAVSYVNSLFSNIRTGFRIRPKLEYSLFPYKKFNTERVVLQYMIGPTINNYYDSTIFFKEKETVLQQNVNLIASFTKPWGAINLGVFYANYFDDFEKNNLSFNSGISWKVTKGLNLAVWGYYSLVNDQITVRKGQATREELLTNNRELLSSYQYGFNVGCSYRFGSIQNSIVNPRFKGLSYSINY